MRQGTDHYVNSSRLLAKAITLLGCAFLLTLVACTTTKSKPKSLSLPETNANDEITMDEVVATDSLKNPDAQKTAKKAKRKKARRKRVPKRLTKACTNLMGRLSQNYRGIHQIYAKSPAGQGATIPKAAKDLIDLRSKDCRTPNRVRVAVSALLTGANESAAKLGVLLPLTGTSSAVGQEILFGLEAALRDSGIDPKQALVVRDTMAQAAQAERHLSELVIQHNVRAFIGGFDPNVAKVMAVWADRLMIPVLLTTSDRDIAKDNRFAKRVYPDARAQAQALVAAAQRRNIRRVAIVRPNHGRADNLAEAFSQEFQAYGGAITDDLKFQPGDYDSMDMVGRSLFRIDAVTRQDEYQRAMWRARARARSQGMPFDPRLVVLTPIVEFDAILLPADFRTVRHFIKLFKFHGVKEMPLLGNHEWRSPALIDPFEDMLRGAVFADFIGNYTKLPPAIAKQVPGQPMFVPGEIAGKIDVQMLGYRAGLVGVAALQNSKVKRRHIATAWSRMVNQQNPHLRQGQVFQQDDSLDWQAHLFGVGDERLDLLTESSTPRIAPQAPRSANPQTPNNAPQNAIPAINAQR